MKTSQWVQPVTGECDLLGMIESNRSRGRERKKERESKRERERERTQIEIESKNTTLGG